MNTPNTDGLDHVNATTLRVLEDARTLLADPEHWTKRALARNTRGRRTDPKNPAACKWCLEGAVRKVAPGDDYPLSSSFALGILWEHINTPDIWVFNDQQSTKHEHVLATLDTAIQHVREIAGLPT